MVQCEMCGAETSAPQTIKVEGAKLDVCSNCTDFGTAVSTDSADSSQSTKYSTSSGSANTSSSSSRSRSTTSSTSSTSTSSGGGGGRSRRSRDMYDDVDELATDYDDRIRRAREERGLSQSDLAQELNEKASLIRKLERGETLPSDAVQSKLERFLDMSLTGDADVPDEEEWSSDAETGGTTLGDVVQRKD